VSAQAGAFTSQSPKEFIESACFIGHALTHQPFSEQLERLEDPATHCDSDDDSATAPVDWLDETLRCRRYTPPTRSTMQEAGPTVSLGR
jgi:hypothetical protein